MNAWIESYNFMEMEVYAYSCGHVAYCGNFPVFLLELLYRCDYWMNYDVHDAKKVMHKELGSSRGECPELTQT